jgi:tape measure domain-containing protein
MEGGDLRMSSIDQRVVQMTFDNRQFEQGIATTLASLNKLSQGLKLEGATKGLGEVEKAANSFSLGRIADGVEEIGGKFKAMSVIGITALSELTSKAIESGIELVKKFTIEPITEGFKNYETEINAIQVVLANTQRYGTTLPQVRDALNELNKYANQTVYNFSEMADNIGRFTADGVNLETAVSSIKGIANLAAMSGATTQQASTGMYQLSQAIAAGVVHLQDWNSVVNAGFGGKVFQDALVETARVHGVAVDSMIKKEGSFRMSLQKGWLTSQILTETLSKFTGDLSDAQLKSMGYTKEQITQIQAQAKAAVQAATNIKTLSQLTQALKEEVATAYGIVFRTIFGDLDEATVLFTNLHNVLENGLTNPIYALNKVLEGWASLGGRTVLIDGLTKAFQALSAIIKPIKDAFREIFPPTTAKQLYDMTVSFRDFMEKLKIGGQTAEELKRTFAGVFAVIKIVVDVVVALGKEIFTLLGKVTPASGGILKFTANMGDWLVKAKDFVEHGDRINKLLETFNKKVDEAVTKVKEFAGHIEKIFSKIDTSKFEKSLDNVGKKLGPFGKLWDLADKAWASLYAHLGAIAKYFEPLAEKFETFFKKLGSAVMSIVSGMGDINFKDVLNAIDTGLFAGLVLLVKKIVDRFKGGHDSNPIEGFVDTIKETFEALTKTFEQMQKTLKAATLLEIALAIGVMTISVSKLAKIDSGGLLRASSAITAMFVQLMGTMVIFDKFVTGEGVGKMPLMMGSLILLALAIDILASAVKKMSGLSWSELEKGLTGLSVILLSLAGSIRLMGNPETMISTGLGMIALAKGVEILVKAVTQLSNLSWDQLGKGLAGVGAILLELGLFGKFAEADKAGAISGIGILLLAEAINLLVKPIEKFSNFSWTQIGKGLSTLAGALASIGGALVLIPPSSVLSAAAVLIVATSLGMIGDAIKKMGNLSWTQIGKGLAELAGALGLIAAALALLPPTSLLSAAAIFVVAESLSTITDALVKMGGMSWTQIGKSLLELAGALAIIAGALYLMEAALPGAAALVVVAGALMLLQPVLKAFGEMSWTEIGKSLLMLAGVFVVLGAAGLLLGPVTPVILALGAAVVLFGVGVMAAGAGVFFFAAGLTALSIAGAAGAAALTAIVTAMLGLLPEVAKQIGKAVITFAETIGAAAPAIVDAIVKVLSALIDGIVKLTPKVVDALLKLLSMLLDELNKYVPHLIDAGSNLVIAILKGFAAKIGGIVSAATDLIVAFLNGIANNQGRVLQAAADLIIGFVNKLADTIRSNAPALGSAGGNLAEAIIEGMITGLGSGVGRIVSAAGDLAKKAIDSAKSVLDINSPSKEFIKIGQSVNEGFYKGLTSGNASDVDKAFQSLADKMQTLTDDAGNRVDSLEKKLNKLTSARHRNRAAIAETRKELEEARDDQARDAAAYDLVTNGLWQQHQALDNLANSYQNVKQQIVDANKALDEAIKTRDKYNEQVSKQFGTTDKVQAGETVAQYESDLAKKIEKTKEFANVLQRLHQLGLSDAEYMDLLSQGTDVLPFAQQILDSGKAGVDHLNDLNNQLATAAGAFGKTASTDLYQAAVDSAAGLVKGLEDQKAAIEDQMNQIATDMVNAIKRQLGIRSPSRVFAEIGGFTAQGLADGFAASSSVVENSVTAVGDKAIEAMGRSLANISTLVSSNLDVNPTITPVLDLSSVKKDAAQIGTMIGAQSISVQSAYSKAVIASAGYMSNMAAAQQSAPQSQSPAVTFNQYNSSPVALSSAEVYRQTRNQLSQVRGALVYSTGSPQ